GASTTWPSTVTQPPVMYRSASRREQPNSSMTRLDRRVGSLMVVLDKKKIIVPARCWQVGKKKPRRLRGSSDWSGSDQLAPHVVFVGIDDAHAHLIARLDRSGVDEHAAVDLRGVGPGAGHGTFAVHFVDQHV